MAINLRKPPLPEDFDPVSQRWIWPSELPIVTVSDSHEERLVPLTEHCDRTFGRYGSYLDEYLAKYRTYNHPTTADDVQRFNILKDMYADEIRVHGDHFIDFLCDEHKINRKYVKSRQLVDDLRTTALPAYHHTLTKAQKREDRQLIAHGTKRDRQNVPNKQRKNKTRTKKGTPLFDKNRILSAIVAGAGSVSVIEIASHGATLVACGVGVLGCGVVSMVSSSKWRP